MRFWLQGARAAATQNLGHGAAGGHRVQRVHEGRVDLRVRREPSVGRPRDDDTDRRAVVDLVAQLARDAETAGGLRLTVQDEQVEVGLVDQGDALVTVMPTAGRAPMAWRIRSRTAGLSL